MTASTTDPDLKRLHIDRTAPGRRRRTPAGRALRAVVVLSLAVVVGYGVWLSVATLLPARGLAVEIARAARVDPASAAQLTSASGYVVARVKAQVAAPIQGRLVALHVDSGDHVRAGQVLAEVQHDELDAALSAARGDRDRLAALVEVEAATRTHDEKALAAARASHEEAELSLADVRAALGLAERRLARKQALFDQRTISEDELDGARTARDRARAVLDAASARLRFAAAEVERLRARLTLDDRRIEAARKALAAAEAAVARAVAARDLAFVRAPFDGVVLRKNAEVGEVVTPTSFGGTGSRTAIVTMADFSTLEFEVDLFERDIGLVREGGPCRIVLDAFPDRPMRGRVRRVEPTADKQNATVKVKIEFLDRHPRMLPEMGGRASFLRSGEERAARATVRILVPKEAIVRRDGAAGVFVVERDRARFVTVRTGPEEDGRIRVLDGLRGGEQVVLRPPEDLRDGGRVRTGADTD